REVPVAARYRLVGQTSYAFDVTGEVDPARKLIIDPELTWSTFLGGNKHDSGNGIAVDAAGNVYVTGHTYSADFPTSDGFDATHSVIDAFVTKISAGGDLLWSTFLGGNDLDYGNDVAVDPNGNALVTGRTNSSDFPAFGNLDTTHNGGDDCFVAKISADGDLVWSGFIGGSGNDEAGGIATDAGGSALVAGHTVSSDFPTPNGYDTTLGGQLDAFAAKVTPDGSLEWATFIGGGSYDKASDISTDPNGNALITGYTDSADFPTAGGFDTDHNGNWDVFVAKMTNDGQLAWASFLGGSDIDIGRAIAADTHGNAYITGQTESEDFPASGGPDTDYNGGRDAFVARVTASGQLAWAGYLGAAGSEQGRGIAMGPSGNAFITGETDSPDFPTPGVLDTSHNGMSDAFTAKVTPDGQLAQAAFTGGAKPDYGYAVAVDADGNTLITGRTRSADFPTPRGFDVGLNGDWDSFVAKIAVTFVLSVKSTPLTGVSITGTPPGMTNYLVEVARNSEAAVTAPATANANGAEYVFARWLINGIAQSDGLTDANVMMTSDHNLTAEYYRIWYVDPAGANGNGTEANPFGAIQQAIDAASHGDVIILRDGTYTGDGNRDIDFAGKTVTLRSENGPSGCIVDCEGGEAAPHGGILFYSGEGPSSIVDGLTIRGAYGGDGGGIYCSGTSPTLKNCIIADCRAWYGAALFCSNASPALINVTITGNTAMLTGGGVYCFGSPRPNIANSIIWGNTGGQIVDPGVAVAYSNVEGGYNGQGNIDVNPRFADPTNGDYHLRSSYGRWSTADQDWATDNNTSLCVDRGDPASDYSREPQPNGQRINIGAYGNTAEASKAAIHTLTVESQPVNGLNITGDKPGTTDYTVFCLVGEVVNLAAPLSTLEGDLDYAFERWRIDDDDQPQGQATVQVVMEQSRTAKAIYRIVTHTLTVESAPADGVSIGGTHTGTTAYTVDVDDETAVSLAAPWQVGSQVFLRWKDPADTTLIQAATLAFTMTVDRTVIAEYGNATEFYVNDDQPDNGIAIGNNAYHGRSPDKPMAWIQSLLNRYPNIGIGCTLHVSVGTYVENITIGAGHSGLALEGAGAGRSIVDGGGGGSCLRVNGLAGGTISGFTFTNGQATEGGGIYSGNSSVTITNSILAGNSANHGAGLYCLDSSPTLGNVTIADNSANDGGGIYSSGASSPNITNSIIWNNTPGQITGGSPVVTYCDVQGGHLGESNINVDPLFIDPTNLDYHLKSEGGRWNPATQAWDTDPATSQCTVAGDPAADFANEPLPNAARVNIGAYGNTSEASKSEWAIRTDVNFDCVVNILDLLNIRNHLRDDVTAEDNWLFDVNGDRKIDILDLIAVRNKLGTMCP
ncbi:MAG: SBBP repeat-containing protein, partial [Planctomycetes bacterium]|nr:SBBP repeat-containing protein [Planctomycetota bacterium]